MIRACISIKSANIFFALLLTTTGAFAQQSTPEKVMASVNGKGITQLELSHFRMRQKNPTDEASAVQEMINVELLNQAAEEEGFLDTPLLQLEIKRSRDALVASLYLQKLLSNLEITEQQLKQRYQKEYAIMETSMEYNASHILVDSEAEAQDIIKRLQAGENFEALAIALSTGPSGKAGGDLGWFKIGDMVPEFSQAAQQMTPGQYSMEPVQTQFGWHVILLKDIRKIPPPEFESVKKDLSTLIAAEAIQNKVKSLRDKASIKLNPEQ